jgi:hypothetical protein
VHRARRQGLKARANFGWFCDCTSHANFAQEGILPAQELFAPPSPDAGALGIGQMQISRLEVDREDYRQGLANLAKVW